MNHLYEYGLDDRVCELASAAPSGFLARVIAQSRESYTVIGERGEYRAEPAGKMRRQISDIRGFPVVGDWVITDSPDDGGGTAQIQQVLQRKSRLERTAAGKTGQAQVMAANIDLVYICMGLDHDFNLRRLERYLAIVCASGARPVVLLTKSDLCGNIADRIAAASSCAPGVDILTCSCYDRGAIDAVRQTIRPGETAAFIGSSGVGKSSLINGLEGAELARTGAVRENDGRGRHTTTRRQLFLLANGSLIVDMPGMRELGVRETEADDTFRDIAALAKQCRFQNCSHMAEPGCAVRAAIETGDLDGARLVSYNRLQHEARHSQHRERAALLKSARKGAPKPAVRGAKYKNKSFSEEQEKNEL